MKNITIRDEDHEYIRGRSDDWQEPIWYVVQRLITKARLNDAAERNRRRYANLNEYGSHCVEVLGCR